MTENKNSAAGCIDWEKMAKAMADGKKLANSIKKNMDWSKINVSGKPEEVSETTDEEETDEDRWRRLFYEQQDIETTMYCQKKIGIE